MILWRASSKVKLSQFAVDVILVIGLTSSYWYELELDARPIGMDMPSSNAVISFSYVLYCIQSNHSGDHALASHSNDRNIICKEFMTKNVELWIDYQKAMLLTMTEKGEDLKEIRSEVERDLEIFADDRRQSGFTECLNIYYDAVINCMRDADSILVFGKGEAKNEFRKRLEKDNLGDRIVDVLTCDKMSDHQIVAKVQEHFDKMIDHQLAAKVQKYFHANQLVRKEN